MLRKAAVKAEDRAEATLRATKEMSAIQDILNLIRENAEKRNSEIMWKSKKGRRLSAADQGAALPAENEILKMSGITKDYQMGDEVSHVLKGIDLTVTRGEFLAILGPSGSGKSTLMNIIGCLDTPTQGDYWLSGRHIAAQNETALAKIRSREIGFIFQSFYLLQRQSAFENVELPLLYAGMGERERKERVREVMERVQLSDKMYHYPNQLSGGQQQRVAIARAVANNPTILLADEPTGALDQITGRQVMELFHSLNEEGRTIIMITHDAKIAAHASRIVRILDGNLSAGGVEDA